jgi:hypothetical protein
LNKHTLIHKTYVLGEERGMEILKGEKKNVTPIITKGRKINPSKAHSLCFTYMIFQSGSAI